MKQLDHIILTYIQSLTKNSVTPKRVHAALPDELMVSKDDVWNSLQYLANEGFLIKQAGSTFTAKQHVQLLIGKLDINRRGAGFVIPSNNDLDGADVQIGKHSMQGVLQDDLVECTYSARGNKFVGDIVKVIERSNKIWIGTLDVFENAAYLIPKDKNGPQYILIKHGIKDYMHGQVASVKITDFNAKRKFPVGELIELLGNAGSNDSEMHAIVAEFGFNTQFLPDTLVEARKFGDTIDPKDIVNRVDLRNTLTFTIDPEDAKDFDDAISFEVLPNNLFKIGVHIADVSHYVQQGTALDKEALERGTSVYLADRTIPMLPENLSNNLCSLKPNVDRFAFSVMFEINLEGEVSNVSYFKSVIHSNHRFSYEEAQKQIVTGEGVLANELIICNNIALNLRAKRDEVGAIGFETVEIRFVLDKNGKPTGVKKKVRFEAHKLIEEFMLLANKQVAYYVKTLQKPELPYIYRSHDYPPNERLIDLANQAKLWGYSIDIFNEAKLRESINKLIKDSEGKPEGNLLQSLAIRSMAKAVYTSEKSMHFGLAFDFYTHFTSPIRRYPDLIAHRLLQAYLTKNFAVLTFAEIEHMAKHSSAMEQKASDAERASTKYKMAEYMEQFVGKTMDARITGVTDWGIFAEVLDHYCEGMIRISDLKGDHFSFNEKERKVIGKRTQVKYGLGDLITIRVKKTDKTLRQIDFSLINE